jgi:hypothetical protein
MRLFIFLIAFSLSNLAHAQSSKTSARIDGVAAFLIDRANENYLFIFEKKIKDNINVQCFLPNTLKVLTISGQGGLKQLISSKSLWREMLVKDLEVLTVRSLAYTLQKETQIGNQVVSINSNIIEALQKLSIKYDGENVSLVAPPYDANDELKQIINGFYDPLESITNAMSVFRRYASKDNSRESICAAPISNISEFKQSIEGLIQAPSKLSAWKTHWDKYKSAMTLSTDGWIAMCTELNLGNQASQCVDESSAREQILKLFEKSNQQSKKMLSSLIVAAENLNQILDENEKNVMPTVIEALDLLQKDQVLSPDEFQKFAKYVRFFGMLADATSSQEVEGILESFTLPAVSFYLKREAGNHFMVTSYFGFSLNANKNNDSQKQNNGFFVPVGLEYTLDKSLLGLDYDGSLSVMASPFDFGYPVNLKLNGASENFEFNEIVAPSITLSYGLKEYPVVFGLGIQKGAKLETSGETENRVLLFVAFDMPLFNLFDL